MLDIQNLDFSYDKQSIFKNFHLKVETGKIISIIGESGSGKSTLLKLIYGLLEWQNGDIYFNKTKLLGPKGNLVPGEREMKWVSQDFNLMPYTTVAENVGEFYSNIDLPSKDKKIEALLEVVDLYEFKNTQVKNLSGGQKQRVALAKALSEVPKLLLLDEPFSQIDNFRKNKLQRKFFEEIKKHSITTIMVTHQLEDALSSSDYIYVLEKGKFIDAGIPEQIYQFPKNTSVAQLLGDINILNGLKFNAENKTFYIHPEDVILSEKGFEGVVTNSFYKGSHFLLEITFKDEKILMNAPSAIPKGQKIYFSIPKITSQKP